MGKLRLILSATLLAVACSGPEGLNAPAERGLDHSAHARLPAGPDYPAKPEDGRPEVYLSGVRYPSGYDWRHAAEEAEHVVFLLGDGEPLFESSSAPAEADTRHISNGRLFHTVTVGDSTVVCANGVRQFAYCAQEMTAALEDDGKGHIMTLGEPRSTETSFTYRVNGSSKLKRKGVLIGPEIKDKRFSYRDAKGRFITVENGVEKDPVEPAADGEIAAAITRGGKTYAYEKVGPYILIQSGGKGIYLAAPNTRFNSIRLEDWFFHDGEGFLTFVSAKDDKGNPAALVYRNDKLHKRFDGYEFYNILQSGNALAYILKEYGKEAYAVIDKSGEPQPLPEGFIPHSKRAMDYSGTILRMALDSPDGPVLWQNGSMTRFAFNGYFDCITTRD